MDNPYQIIKTIALTEKSHSLLEHNQYSFIVDPAANKMDIKRAVEYLFERKVKAVNVMNRRGKTKSNQPCSPIETPEGLKEQPRIQIDTEPEEDGSSQPY